MKVLVKKSYRFVETLWAMYIDHNKVDVRYSNYYDLVYYYVCGPNALLYEVFVYVQEYTL